MRELGYITDLTGLGGGVGAGEGSVLDAGWSPQDQDADILQPRHWLGFATDQ